MSEPMPPTPMNFRCNICGRDVSYPRPEDLTREGAFCPNCGSNVRIRAIVHLLGQAMHVGSLPMYKWVKTNRSVYGVSDWHAFGAMLTEVCDYVNTQFDVDLYPNAIFLDVANPSAGFRRVADIVICSEVLEHVAPPIQRAFDGLFLMLRPGGHLIFTVPYTFDETVEHFPDLYDWQLSYEKDKFVLRNETRSGNEQVFENLVFHGGGETVLEMRLFGLRHIVRCLKYAGFVDICVMDREVNESGIRFDLWSRAISARRP